MRKITLAVIGIALGITIAPVVGPVLLRMGRPVAKSTTKAGLMIYRSGRDKILHLRETLDDILAESRHELDWKRNKKVTYSSARGYSLCHKKDWLLSCNWWTIFVTDALNFSLWVGETLLRWCLCNPLEGTMIHKAHVVHHIPGRLRMRIPNRKHDHAFFGDVKDRLNSVPGVRADATAQTGSILVHYEGSFAEMLLQIAETGLANLLEVEMGEPPLLPMAMQLAQQARSVDGRLKAISGGTLDAQTVILLSLIFATGVQLVRGQIFGPAVPLLWYAAETVRHYLPSRQA
jgi:hypothetical protein